MSETRPSPFQLWMDAGRDPDRYAALMREQGHVVPIEPCPACGEATNHRHDPLRGKVFVDIFGHDKRTEPHP